MKIFDFFKTNDQNKTFRAEVVMINGFALNHDKNLQIYFLCVKRQAKYMYNFLKDVESTVVFVFILSLLKEIDTLGRF